MHVTTLAHALGTMKGLGLRIENPSTVVWRFDLCKIVCKHMQVANYSVDATLSRCKRLLGLCEHLSKGSRQSVAQLLEEKDTFAEVSFQQSFSDESGSGQYWLSTGVSLALMQRPALLLSCEPCRAEPACKPR